MISEDKLYSNNKSNIGFSSGIYNLITFKITSYKRLLKICIDINNDKPTPHQPLLILFLITDFSHTWKNNLIYSTQGMCYKLSWLIVYISMIYCYLNAANILISSDYSIYKQ